MFRMSVPITKGTAGFSQTSNSLSNKTSSWLNNNIEKCGKPQFYGFILLFVKIFELRRVDCS